MELKERAVKARARGLQSQPGTRKPGPGPDPDPGPGPANFFFKFTRAGSGPAKFYVK